MSPMIPSGELRWVVVILSEMGYTSRRGGFPMAIGWGERKTESV